VSLHKVNKLDWPTESAIDAKLLCFTNVRNYEFIINTHVELQKFCALPRPIDNRESSALRLCG
jgi:hypothetical protein